MKILIGSDDKGFELKQHLKKYIEEQGHVVVDKTPKMGLDLVESANLVANGILNKEGDRGIVIDEYGAGSFMVASKHKGITCAEVSDEHSSKMTRCHNDASIIALGSGIVGVKLAEGIVDAYLKAEYAGGRHQIRVDMLNKML